MAGTGFLWTPGGGRGGSGGGAKDHCELFADSTGCDDVPADVSGKGEGDCEDILVDGPDWRLVVISWSKECLFEYVMVYRKDSIRTHTNQRNGAVV